MRHHAACLRTYAHALILCACAQMPSVTLRAHVDASDVVLWLVEIVRVLPLADDGWEVFQGAPVCSDPACCHTVAMPV